VNNLFQGFLNAIKAKFVPMWTKIRLLTNPTYLKNEVLRRLIVYFPFLPMRFRVNLRWNTICGTFIAYVTSR